MNLKVHRGVRLVIALSVVPAFGISQPAAAEEEATTLDEIVVTAQKREESLRDVPISVEAVLGDKLQDAGIVRIDDLQAYVPNLQMSETGIANNIYIRGIGSGLNQGFEQSVSLYQDGVYHGRGHQARMPFVDLARVEVLRGPQPILFGKNAVAGAVNLIANQPTREFEASARVSRDFENDETTADAAISGPVTEAMRGRLAAFYRKSDGYETNLLLGNNEPRHDDIGARLTLTTDLGSSLTATLRTEFGNFDTDGRQVEIFGETPVTAPGLPWTGATYSQALNSLTSGTIPGLLNNTLDGSRASTGENFSNNRFREAALTLDYSFAGGIGMTSVSAFSKYTLDEGCDCDFVAAPLITATLGEKYRQYSEELRFTSPAGARLQWIGGMYFQKYTLDERDSLHVPTSAEEPNLPVPIGSLVPTLIAGDPTARNTVAGALYLGGHPACAGGPSSGTCQTAASTYIQTLFRGASNPRDFSQDSTMYSAFMQGTWKFNEKWSATLGARVNREKKDGYRHAWIDSLICSTDGTPQLLPTTASASCTSAALANGLFGNVLGIVQHEVSGSRSETNVSPLFNLQYHASSRSLGYLAVSQGYKSGGFDARSNKPPTAGGTFEFKQERATTYEVGIKSQSASGRAEGSVAVFYTDYKDLQTSAFDGRIGFNVGNGSAEVRGVEFEGRWRPVNSLVLKASMGALDFKWTRYTGQCYYDLVGTPACVSGNADYSGENNQLAPHFTGVLSAEHTAHLGGLALVSTLDVVHSSSYLQSLNLDPLLRQTAFTKLNARIGIGDDYDHWQVAVVGKNLTDKRTVGYAADAPLAQALFKARSYYGFVDPPRSLGVELRVHF